MSSSITLNPGANVAPALRPFAALAAFFGALSRAQAAAADYERLSALSDAALAREGLTRPDIARRVMERHFG